MNSSCMVKGARNVHTNVYFLSQRDKHMYIQNKVSLVSHAWDLSKGASALARKHFPLMFSIEIKEWFIYITKRKCLVLMLTTCQFLMCCLMNKNNVPHLYTITTVDKGPQQHSIHCIMRWGRELAAQFGPGTHLGVTIYLAHYEPRC